MAPLVTSYMLPVNLTCVRSGPKRVNTSANPNAVTLVHVIPGSKHGYKTLNSKAKSLIVAMFESMGYTVEMMSMMPYCTFSD